MILRTLVVEYWIGTQSRAHKRIFTVLGTYFFEKIWIPAG